MKHNRPSFSLWLLLGVLIVVGVAMLINNRAQAQVPNNILLPPGPEDTYSIEIEYNDAYWVTNVKDSRGVETTIEYDELGNRTSVEKVPYNPTATESVASGELSKEEGENPGEVTSPIVEVLSSEMPADEDGITRDHSVRKSFFVRIFEYFGFSFKNRK